MEKVSSASEQLPEESNPLNGFVSVRNSTLFCWQNVALHNNWTFEGSNPIIIES